MAYDSTNKRVYVDTSASKGGITPWDIAQCIGDYRVTKFGRSIGLLATSPNINKFSIKKPIRYNTLDALTDEQFKGMTTDISQNILYGIKINGPVSAVIDSTLVNIHDTEFEYIRPTGGLSEPFRMLDFDGYDHKAMPNPGAAFNAESLEAYYNDEDFQMGSLSGIAVRYSNTNTTGVDFTSMYADTSESVVNVLARSYPCILVTDSNGVSYFTALDYPFDDGTYGPCPLYNSSTQAYVGSGNWSVRMSKPRYVTASGSASTKPWSVAQTGMRATLFLIKSAVLNGPYLDSARKINFAENWIPIADSMAITSKPIVLPADKLGIELALKQYLTGVIFTPYSVTYSALGVSVNMSKEGSSDNTLSVSVAITINGVTKIKTVSVSGSLDTTPVVTFTTSDLGMAFISGTTYTAKVSITTVDGAASNIRTGTFNFTA